MSKAKPNDAESIRTSENDPELSREERYFLRAPSKLGRLCEARALLETLTLPPSALWLLLQPRGDQRQVMLIPGFMADDRSTWPLRRYLQHLGYSTLPWSLGRNVLNPQNSAHRLIEHLDTVRHVDESITLIGWSLGGVISREVARLRPDAVREVITMGTPLEGGPKYTAVADRVARNHKLDLDAAEQRIHHINSAGLTQPLTVIYSKSDGIVGWRAAIDRYNAHARHVRVPGSHLGLGTNPLVWREIAKTLAGHRRHQQTA